MTNLVNITPSLNPVYFLDVFLDSFLFINSRSTYPNSQQKIIFQHPFYLMNSCLCPSFYFLLLQSRSTDFIPIACHRATAYCCVYCILRHCSAAFQKTWCADARAGACFYDAAPLSKHWSASLQSKWDEQTRKRNKENYSYVPHRSRDQIEYLIQNRNRE